FKNIKWFVELRVALRDFITEYRHLCILAPQAQYGCSRHIRVCDVTRKETTQRIRIDARTTAPHLMIKEFDPIHVGKQLLTIVLTPLHCDIGIEDIVYGISGLVYPDKLLHFGCIIAYAFAVTQPCLQGTLPNKDIPVLTKYHWDNQPV